jgi:hypothetical protein
MRDSDRPGDRYDFVWRGSWDGERLPRSGSDKSAHSYFGNHVYGEGHHRNNSNDANPDGFTGFPPALEIGAGKVFGIYLMFWIFLSIVAATHLALTRFAWGGKSFSGEQSRCRAQYRLQHPADHKCSLLPNGRAFGVGGSTYDGAGATANRYLG